MNFYSLSPCQPRLMTMSLATGSGGGGGGDMVQQSTAQATSCRYYLVWLSTHYRGYNRSIRR